MKTHKLCNRVVAVAMLVMVILFLSVTTPVVGVQADGPITFTEHVVTTNAPGGKWVYAEDVDGDGDMDILSASTMNDNNPAHEKVEWHENTAGDGTAWINRVIYSANDNDNWVYAADMDNDGDMDVLSTSRDDSRISWYENDGNSPPGFTARIIAIVWGGRMVHAADVDGDGDMDVLAPSGNDDRVIWYENNGGVPLSFTPHVITATADGAQSVYGVDVDSDGDMDVLAGSINDNKVAWYENNGASDPTFTSHVITTTALRVYSIYPSDVDGDGDLDVLSVGYDANGKTIWYENDGASPPAFTAHIIDANADYALSVYATDVDGDGDTDVLATLAGGTQVVWYENDGAFDPVFTSHVITTNTIGVAKSVYAADVDGDGDKDVIAGAPIDNIAWFENESDEVNSPPIADTGGPYSVDEGSSIPLTGSNSFDPDPGDTLTFEWDLDNDGTYESSGQSVIFSAAGHDGPGDQIVTLKVCDIPNACDSDSTLVTITNVAPTATFSNTSGTISEGETATLAFSNPFDPGEADTTAGFLHSYDCTDDGTFELSDDSSVSFVCYYPDNGDFTAFTAKGRIKDKNGGFSDYTVGVPVNNVAPIVGEIIAPLNPVQINTEISASTNFTDPGALDTQAALWDWGDGKTSEGTVNEIDGSGSIFGSHTYTEPGVYTVKLTVTDNDGDSGESVLQFVVIFDPSGGFVTGGGLIDSPDGACRFDVCTDNTTGKATFGFVSKYKKGADVPTGNTEFQFKAGNLNFHSTSYQWLVVAGAKAQFKGDGTINGAGNYGFMLTAIDGEVNGGGGSDKFRIKIWDKAIDEVVYDNQMDAAEDADPSTEIRGGNIVVHKAKE